MEDYWTRNNLTKPQQIVVCAACRLDYEGEKIILTGARHWDSVMCRMADALVIDGGDEEQGFIDQFGDFLTREEAMQIVLKNGQPFDKDRNGGGTSGLFSEGLY